MKIFYYFCIRMKQSICYISLLLLLLTGCGGNKKAERKAEPLDTIPMMVMQIQKCSKLYTAEYHLHKIVTHDDQMRLKGKLSWRGNLTSRCPSATAALPSR